MAHEDVKRVISAIPSPGAVSKAKLRRLAVAALLEVLTDPKRPWWRRRACAEALQGRLSTDEAREVFARVKEPKETGEVAIACLHALTDAWGTAPPDEALAWMRAQDGRELGYGVNDAVLAARGRVGDLTAAPALAELAFSPWTHRRQAAEQAVSALVDARGVASVVQHLAPGTEGSWPALLADGATPAVRHLGLLMDPQPTVEACFAALADVDVAIAHAAHARLVEMDVSADALLALFDTHEEALAQSHTAPPPLTGTAAAACWALVVAHRLAPTYATRLEVQTRWNGVGQPHLLHPGVPEDVRDAILREHLPAQRETDPRLLVEGILLREAEARDDDAYARIAETALDDAGLSPAEPVSAGMEYRQGAGTYHVVKTARFTVTVSELGPWVAHGEELPPEARRALTEAGLVLLDGTLLERRFEGLPVYFFGDRVPLPIQDLLFYWQD